MTIAGSTHTHPFMIRRAKEKQASRKAKEPCNSPYGDSKPDRRTAKGWERVTSLTHTQAAVSPAELEMPRVSRS